MSKLYEYVNHYVRIVDNNNVKYEGFVDGYTKALDNEENEACIDVLPAKSSDSGIEFFESDIRSIEIIKRS